MMRSLAGRRHGLAVCALLTCHALLLLYSARVHAVTVDEGQHLAAGTHHWQTGQFYLYRVNPPLVRMLATIPVMIHGVAPAAALDDVPGVRQELDYHAAFAEANRADYEQLVFLGRLVGIAWSVLGALLVHAWAARLFGRGAALACLAIWCFDPNIIAHASILTPDIPAAVAAFGATFALWRYLEAPSWKRALLAGGLLGIALLTKTTLVVLVPVWFLLACGWVVSQAREDRRRARAAALRTLAHGVIGLTLALVVVNAGYGFRGSGTRLGDLTLVSAGFGNHAGTPFPTPERPYARSWARGLPLPLPADYLLGIDLQRFDFERPMVSYVAGSWSSRGHWYYYLYGLALKVPIGFLALWIAGLALLLRRARDGEPRARERWLLVLPPLAVLALVSSQTHFNHHLRYVFPILPFVITAAGGAIAVALRRASWTVAAVALVALGAASSLRTYPHAMSYFNELAGGPAHGSDHLDNSNIDWGQDLLYLRRWVDDHPEARPLGLAYFGVADPRVYGLAYVMAPPVQGIVVPTYHAASEDRGPHPGYFAISVNYLIGTTFFCYKHPHEHPTLCGGRDFQYFQSLTPVARAGYSINIYHLTVEGANELRYRFGFEPLHE